MKIEKFVRKPFEVEGIRVDEENMTEVAEWCKGNVFVQSNGVAFVKVKVHKPLSERQTKAFVGDWVLKSVSGFKVYSDIAFIKSFIPIVDLTERDFIKELEKDPKLLTEYLEARLQDPAITDIERQHYTNTLATLR